jgi:hypothetical protein
LAVVDQILEVVSILIAIASVATALDYLLSSFTIKG